MRQPSEEEIRALEAEMEKLTVDDVLLQTVVTLVNVGARKAGLVEGGEADLPQLRKAIDAARALLPLLETEHGDELAPVRDALSRLQMVYVQRSGGQPQPAEEPPTEQQPKPEAGGPAQKSGRLWVPGQ
jgi:tRNA-dihydrouridine synthase